MIWEIVEGKVKENLQTKTPWSQISGHHWIYYSKGHSMLTPSSYSADESYQLNMLWRPWAKTRKHIVTFSNEDLINDLMDCHIFQLLWRLSCLAVGTTPSQEHWEVRLPSYLFGRGMRFVDRLKEGQSWKVRVSWFESITRVGLKGQKCCMRIRAWYKG